MLTAAIFHGTINAMAGLPLIVFVGGNDLTVGITGLAGFIALFIANLSIVIYDKVYAKEKVIFKQ
ncbi:MAG: hypothetical protein ACLFSQ_02845 [Candidatus Zixiibacteriota bacterium]